MWTWIGKHWRGEYSLAISFWGNVVAINLLLTWLTGKAETLDSDIIGPLNATRLYVVLIALHSIVLPWQFVGLWRAAGNHRARGGSALISWLACAFLALGIVSNMMSGWRNARSIWETLKVTVGVDYEHVHALRVLEGGTVLALDGGIGFGAAAAVEEALRQTPAIRTIHLNSGGGRVIAARLLNAVIDRAGLDTYTRWGCASACTLAFLAGKKRTMHAAAQLGFHRYAVLGQESDVVAHQHEFDARVFAHAGVTKDFIARAFATAHEDLWLPGPQALYEARVLTAMPAPDEDVLDTHNVWYVDSAEAVLTKNPILNALRKVDAAEFEFYRGWIESLFARGDYLSGLRRDVGILVREIFSKRLAQGTTAPVLALGRVVLRELQIAAAEFPEYCSVSQNTASSNAVGPALEASRPDLMAEEQAAIAQVISSIYVELPQAVASAQMRADFRRRVELQSAHRGSGLTGESQSEGTCAELIFTLQTILNQPAVEAAALLRHWLQFRSLK